MSYPTGDTYNSDFEESAIPFANISPRDPLGKLASPDFTFATGAIRVDGDSVTTHCRPAGGLSATGDGTVPAPAD